MEDTKLRGIQDSYDLLNKDQTPSEISHHKEVNIGKPSGYHQRKAIAIVEQLLDTVDEEQLLSYARFIDPGYYDDAVEERFIIRKCGYPICNNRLKNIARQKYHIDTVLNKVYDMEKKKRFCSHFCCKASNFYAKQLSTEPLWARSDGNNKFVLLNRASNATELSARSLEDDHEITLITNTVEVMNVDDKPKLQSAKSNSQKLTEQLNAEIENITSVNENLNPSKGISKNLDMSCLITHSDLPSGISSSISQHATTGVEENPLKEKLSSDTIVNVHSNHVTDDHCHPPVIHNGKFGNTPEISQTSQQISKSIAAAEPYQKIAQALREWSTPETKHFLSSTHLNESNLCLKDDVSNSIETFETNNVRSKITLSENNRDERSTAEEDRTEVQETNIYLPLNSSNSQASLRRNIVLDRIKKGLREPLSTLNLIYCDIRQDLTELIYTFRLSFKNSTVNTCIKSQQENYRKLLRKLDSDQEQIAQLSSILRDT